MRPVRILALGAAAVMVVAVGCSGGDDSSGFEAYPDLRLVSSLERFDSCDDLQGWVRDELAPRVGAYGPQGGVVDDAVAAQEGGGAGSVGPDAVEEEAAPPVAADDAAVPNGAEQSSAGGDEATSAAPAAPSAPADGSARSSGDAELDQPSDASGTGANADEGATSHSGTNVQVEGVDEPDIVKTDGERILTVADGRLHLASAADPRILDSIELPDGIYANEMFLAGDRVLVIASSPEVIPLDEPASTSRLPDIDVDEDVATDRIVPPMIATTRVVQVDIAGDQLSVSDVFDLDGSYVSARMTDDVARLVLHAQPEQQLPFVTPANPSPEAEEQARQANEEVAEQASPEDLMPRWRQLDTGGAVTDEGTLVECDQAHAPEVFSGFGMVTVVSVDLSDGLRSGVTAANGAGVMAGGQTVYASAEHLYVATPEWIDVPQEEGSFAPGQRRGGGTGSDTAPVEHPGTDIHRFDISDPTQATYEMSGHVDGWLLNQFAMDEHNGNLRVATTTGDPWAEGADESESHVVVLSETEGGLAQVGTVSGLGRGESIYSVRFVGDVGYVVTFEQTDPLYTIDLSDPAAPRMVGELEMLGYSAYLHPIGDGRLIGVGQDATAEGSTLGTQVALFDVSDPAAPTRVAQATLPNASSAAEGDHRAFLWWPDSNLVAIPVSSYDEATGQPFEGLVGYRIDAEAGTITEIGRITHPGEPLDIGGPIPIEPGSGGGSPGRVGPTEPVPAPDEPTDDIVDVEIAPETYPTPILRSLVIDDRIWTASTAGLATSDLATFGSTSFLPFS